jgi:hypothetical protein
VKLVGQHAVLKESPPTAFCMNNPEGLALKSEGSYVQEELQLGGGVKIEVIAMNAVGTAVFVVDAAAAMTAGEKRPSQRECLGKNTK